MLVPPNILAGGPAYWVKKSSNWPEAHVRTAGSRTSPRAPSEKTGFDMAKTFAAPGVRQRAAAARVGGSRGDGSRDGSARRSGAGASLCGDAGGDVGGEDGGGGGSDGDGTGDDSGVSCAVASALTRDRRKMKAAMLLRRAHWSRAIMLHLDVRRLPMGPTVGLAARLARLRARGMPAARPRVYFLLKL